MKYPDKLINCTISRFIATNVSDRPVSISPAAVSDSSDPVRIIFPFKDRSSADIVRRQLQDLSNKIHKTVSPVFVSQKIERDLKMREAKLPLVNQQCLVYKFESDLCKLCWLHISPLTPANWGTQKRKFIHRPALSC